MDMRQTLGAVAVAAAIAGLGGAAVYAATDHPQSGWGPPPGGPPGPHGGPPGAASDSANVLHSETVRTDHTTELTQVGTVVAVSPTSITVRSADGYGQSYTVSDLSTDVVAVDDQVLVRGTRAGDSPATATTIGAPPRGSN